MTRAECSAVLAKAFLTFPQLELTEQHVLAWHEHFGDVPAQVFNAAMKLCLQEPGRKFVPTVGEVKKALDSLRSVPKLDGEKAFKQLLKYARLGMKKEQVFFRVRLLPAVFQALQVIGWDEFRMHEERERPFLRKRFVELYDRYFEEQQTQTRVAEITKKQAQNVLGQVDPNGRLLDQ